MCGFKAMEAFTYASAGWLTVRQGNDAKREAKGWLGAVSDSGEPGADAYPVTNAHWTQSEDGRRTG